MATKPKKPVKPKAKEIIGITPSSGTFGGKPGKATGATDFFKVDEQGKPLEQGQIVGGAFQTGQNVKPSVVPEQLTPEQLAQLNILTQESVAENALKQGLGQGGTLPLAQPQTPAIGQGNGVISETTGQQQPVDTRNAFEQFVNWPRLPGQELTAQEATMRVQPFPIGGGITTTRAALNTPEETGHFTKILKAVFGKITGKAPEVGKLASNTKNAKLLTDIGRVTWGKLLVTAASWSFIQELLTNPEDSARWDRVSANINDAIIANNKAMESETIPEIINAYGQEQDMILQIREDLLNPEAWDAFLLQVPYIDDLKANKLLSKARDSLSESELRRAKINIARSKLVSQRAGQIAILPSDARELLTALTDEEKAIFSLAETSLKGGR